MIRVALTDAFHLHDRNFPSLFKYLEQSDVSYQTLLQKGDDGFRLITSLGCYDDLEDRVSPLAARSIRAEAAVMAGLDADSLYTYESLHIRLWSLCRSELLAYLLVQDGWQQEAMVKDDRAIFDKAYAENRTDLALNMAVANYWLNHWYDRRKDVFSNHFACVFSGSMSYTRTLMELLRRSPTRVMVIESTFTGNDFIFEEMYHPVANNLGVQNATLRVARRDPALEEPDLYDREAIKARNKVLSAKNKNVTQPPSAALPMFPNADARQVLIVGQVANDFSLIEDGFPYVGSIAVYRDMLREILDRTDHNIIFKAHPWEHKKAHLETAKTFDALAEYVGGLTAEERARVLIVEDVNLSDLIDDSDYFVTLCSQAGIEAALLGMRPFILGRAFYSGAGFTVDCPDIGALADALSREDGMLSLEAYKMLDRFLVDLFQYGTVSIFNSGVGKIRRLLQRKTSLVQKSPLKTELQLGRTLQIAPRSVEGWSPILKRKELLPEGAGAKSLLSGNVDLVVRDFPKTFTAGEELSLPVTVVNASDHILPATRSGKTFQVSYHIFGKDGITRLEWNGLNTPLPAAVPEEIFCTMQIKVPERPGTYKFQPALLLPGEFWLETNTMLEMTVA